MAVLGSLKQFGAGQVELDPTAYDLLNLVGQYTHLEMHDGGRYYIGCCPVHGDTRPSLSVQPARGIWKCFACDRGGAAPDFLAFVEGITRDEAVIRLAADSQETDEILKRVKDRLGRIEAKLITPVNRRRLTWGEVQTKLEVRMSLIGGT